MPVRCHPAYAMAEAPKKKKTRALDPRAKRKTREQDAPCAASAHVFIKVLAMRTPRVTAAKVCPRQRRNIRSITTNLLLIAFDRRPSRP
jgi:hypothetical protein